MLKPPSDFQEAVETRLNPPHWMRKVRALAATASTLLSFRGVRRGASKDTPAPEDLLALAAALVATVRGLRVGGDGGEGARAATQRCVAFPLASCLLPLASAAALAATVRRLRVSDGGGEGGAARVRCLPSPRNHRCAITTHLASVTEPLGRLG
jgi:hypothetical protein